MKNKPGYWICFDGSDDGPDVADVGVGTVGLNTAIVEKQKKNNK